MSCPRRILYVACSAGKGGGGGGQGDRVGGTLFWSCVVIPAVAVAVDNEETLGINIVLLRPYPITSNLLRSIFSVTTK